MSAETSFLQRFITLKFNMDNDPRFRPEATHLSGLVDLGIEITIVEANPCTVIFHDTRTEISSLTPGQKAYARSVATTSLRSCKLIDAEVGVRPGPGGVAPVTMHVGLEFPNLSTDSLPRHFAYPRSGDPNLWYDLQPFNGRDQDRIASVTVSLIPFRTSGRLSPAPIAPDDQVHVQARFPGGRDDGVTLSNLRLDPTTQQLIGSGPSLAVQDQASLWLISFFIVPGPPT
jgi:hypothetical protein